MGVKTEVDSLVDQYNYQRMVVEVITSSSKGLDNTNSSKPQMGP